MILQDKQAEQAAQRSDYYADLNYLKNFKSVEVTGRTEFGGQDCYELKLIRSEDDEQGLYINAETYLIAGRVSMSATPQGDVEVITTFEEYKEYDGQQIPVRTHVDFGGFQEQVVTIEEVSFEPYDEEVFALPDSIKALMKDDEAPASQPSD